MATQGSTTNQKSQLSLTELLTLTKTHKFPSLLAIDVAESPQEGRELRLGGGNLLGHAVNRRGHLLGPQPAGKVVVVLQQLGNQLVVGDGADRVFDGLGRLLGLGHEGVHQGLVLLRRLRPAQIVVIAATVPLVVVLIRRGVVDVVGVAPQVVGL